MSETSKEIFERFDRELRISKSGCSIKCGDRIVAKMPVDREQWAKAGKEWQQWFEDAEKLCDLWNAQSKAQPAASVVQDDFDPSDDDVMQWALRHAHVVDYDRGKVIALRAAIGDACSLHMLASAQPAKGN